MIATTVLLETTGNVTTVMTTSIETVFVNITEVPGRSGFLVPYTSGVYEFENDTLIITCNIAFVSNYATLVYLTDDAITGTKVSYRDLQNLR